MFFTPYCHPIWGYCHLRCICKHCVWCSNLYIQYFSDVFVILLLEPSWRGKIILNLAIIPYEVFINWQITKTGEPSVVFTNTRYIWTTHCTAHAHTQHLIYTPRRNALALSNYWNHSRHVSLELFVITIFIPR